MSLQAREDQPQHDPGDPEAPAKIWKDVFDIAEPVWQPSASKSRLSLTAARAARQETPIVSRDSRRSVSLGARRD